LSVQQRAVGPLDDEFAANMRRPISRMPLGRSSRSAAHPLRRALAHDSEQLVAQRARVQAVHDRGRGADDPPGPRRRARPRSEVSARRRRRTTRPGLRRTRRPRCAPKAPQDSRAVVRPSLPTRNCAISKQLVHESAADLRRASASPKPTARHGARRANLTDSEQNDDLTIPRRSPRFPSVLRFQAHGSGDRCDKVRHEHGPRG